MWRQKCIKCGFEDKFSASDSKFFDEFYKNHKRVLNDDIPNKIIWNACVKCAKECIKLFRKNEKYFPELEV